MQEIEGVDDPLVETVCIRIELESYTGMKRWQGHDVRKTQSYCIRSFPRSDEHDESGRSLR